MATLGRELAGRGHRVSLIGTPQAKAKAEACGFEFLQYAVPEHESVPSHAPPFDEPTHAVVAGWKAFGGQGQGRPPQRFHVLVGTFQPLAPPGQESDHGAAFGELPHGCPAHSRGGAGHHDDFGGSAHGRSGLSITGGVGALQLQPRPGPREVGSQHPAGRVEDPVEQQTVDEGVVVEVLEVTEVRHRARGMGVQ